MFTTFNERQTSSLPIRVSLVVDDILVETRFVGTYVLSVSGEYFSTHLNSLDMKPLPQV
jgi:hypothetical protein